MPRKSIKWSGVLRKPIGPRPTKVVGGLLGGNVLDHDSPKGRRWEHEYFIRLAALAERYGVLTDGSDVAEFWRSLAMALAAEVVPGFSEARLGPKSELDSEGAARARLELLHLYERTDANEKLKGLMSDLTSQTKILKHLASRSQRSRLPDWFKTRRHGWKTLEIAVRRARKERDEADALVEAINNSRYRGLSSSLGFGSSYLPLPKDVDGLIGSVTFSAKAKPRK